MEYNKSVAGKAFQISTETGRMQIEKVHRYLSEDSYWAKGIPFEVVSRAIQNSLCFGLFSRQGGETQIGFARVITDRATFAYLCDVYIDESHRGLGLSLWLMEIIMNYPDLQKLRRFMLATVGTHNLYRKFGFEVTATPERWMEIKNPDIYKNWTT